MDESKPSLFSRLLAILVLVVVAVIALRLAIGAVAGLVQAFLWIAVVIALVGAGLWARRTLKGGGGRKRQVEPASPPALTYEDKVEAEMRKISEEMSRRRGG